MSFGFGPLEWHRRRAAEFERQLSSPMNDVKLNKLVDAWVAGHEAERGGPEFRSKWWATSRVIWWGLPNGEPELLWRFILLTYRRELSEYAFGMLAAGPLEDLLSYYGPGYIDRVEALALKDERFKCLLRGVWRLSMTDEVWERVQAVRHESPMGDS